MNPALGANAAAGGAEFAFDNRAAQTATFWSTAGVLFFGLLAFGIALAHLVLLFIYNAPDNVLKIRSQPVQDAFVGRMFAQNWSFFAPSPADRDVSLLARGVTEGGTVTPWVNVSAQMIKAVQHNRLSPYEFIATGVLNAVVDFNDVTIRLREVKDTKKRARMLRAYLHDSLDGALMRRTGAAMLNRLYPGQHFTFEEVGLMVQVIPRFTHRSEPLKEDPDEFGVLDRAAFPSVTPL